jgi:leucyl-tRNA synthetase
MHRTIKRVTSDIDRLSFNTAISSLMIYTNSLAALQGPVPKELIETLILLVSPFAPHIAEECWSLLGHTNSLAYQPWPKFEEKLCIEAFATVAVQVNGKLRGKIQVEAGDISESDILTMALDQPSVVKFTKGNNIKKVVYVPGKILNIVV